MAECGPENPLAAFSKQFEADRSLHNDRFGGNRDEHFQRSMRIGPDELRAQELADEFFRDASRDAPMAGPSGLSGMMNREPFNFHGLGSELEKLAGPSRVGGNWADDFALQQHQIGGPMDPYFAEFEAAFNSAAANRIGTQELAVARAVGTDWKQEFGQFAHGAQDTILHDKDVDAEFQKAFAEAEARSQWAAEFNNAKSGPEQWVDEFNKQEDSWADEFNKQDVDISGDSKEALAKAAGLLLDVVESSTNPKFKQSKFLNFMKQLRDQEVLIEGNKVVESVKPASALGAASDWAREFNTNVSPASWEEEFSLSGETTWAREFESGNHISQAPQGALNTEHGIFEESFNEALSNSAFEGAFKRSMIPSSAMIEGKDVNWEAEWSNMLSHSKEVADYQFMPNNPYLNRPISFLEDPVAHKNLAESILCLEAAVQQDPKNAKAWHHLGVRQQENENDRQAIAAFRACTNADPTLLGAWMGLAVSFTNEAMVQDAYSALESWLKNSTRYQHLLSEPASTSETLIHERLADLFMRAARESVGENLDANVQMGLGVLFNISHEFDKAVDCFEASLSKQPQDYMLWNKLGATLSNSKKHERALDAYDNALQLNPNFIRARFNLAVSCVHLGSYLQAAQHVLTALSIQESNAQGTMGSMAGNQLTSGLFSDSLWAYMRNIAEIYLGRADLVDAVINRDLYELKTKLNHS